jgi:TolB-like protein/DNA-binding winged helix-turn-helix (wHTH) protein/Tfp pilus assembly protein PilF
MGSAVFQFGDYELDLGRYQLRREGRVAKLEKIPMELLVLLVSRRGELVTREEIDGHLWGSEVFVDTQQGINTAIRKIRLALRDNPDAPRFVQTVVGKGYRFLAPVTVVEPVIEVLPSLAIPKGRRRRWWIPATVVTLAILLSGLWSVNRRGTPLANGQQIRSIAVLPLENLSGNPAEEYFADGMTEALITNLAKIRDLRVISRTSVMSYKTARKPLPEIVQALEVDAVVEGSVVRSGNRVRITAQLISATTDQHLWAEEYNRDLHDIISLQNEVASAIVREIRVTLTPDQQRALASRPAVSPVAYEAYLKGRYSWNQRTEEGMRKGIEFFQQAIELDPTNALAYSGLADCYTGLGYLSYLAPKDAFPPARAAAARAVELDSTVAEPHASLGYAKLYYEWDWAGAEREFRSAIALNPNYATGHHWFSVYLTAMGRHEEALAEIRRAQELDPLSLAINTDIGFEAYYSGRYDDAVRQLHAVLTVNAGFPLAHLWLGRTYQQMSRYPQAIAEYDKTQVVLGDWPVTLAALGNAYGFLQERGKASDILEKMRELSRQEYVTAYGVALVYAGLGEKDQAFDWLDKGVEERTHWLVWLKLDPRWVKIRSDPRFASLLHRVGLPS